MKQIFLSYNTLTLLNNMADNDKKPKLTDNPKKNNTRKKIGKGKGPEVVRSCNWFTLQLQTSSILRGNDRY